MILGPSGSGKSTVLNILGGLAQLSSGELYFHGSTLHQTKEPQLTNFRREHIGFVFQFYNLIGNLSAIENIKMSAQISKNLIDAETLINQIGLADKRDQLKDFNRKYGKTVLIITHNSDISKIADRSIYIRDGVIDRVDVNPDPMDPGEVDW